MRITGSAPITHRTASPPVKKEYVWQDGAAVARFDQAQPEVPVLIALDRHLLVVASERDDSRPPDESRGDDGVFAEQRGEVAALRLRPETMLVAEHLESRGDEGQGRIPVE